MSDLEKIRERWERVDLRKLDHFLINGGDAWSMSKDLSSAIAAAPTDIADLIEEVGAVAGESERTKG